MPFIMKNAPVKIRRSDVESAFAVRNVSDVLRYSDAVNGTKEDPAPLANDPRVGVGTGPYVVRGEKVTKKTKLVDTFNGTTTIKKSATTYPNPKIRTDARGLSAQSALRTIANNGDSIGRMMKKDRQDRRVTITTTEAM